MGYSKAYSERLVRNYTEEIETQKRNIDKNFNDMDFQNAVAKNECKEIVDDMINNCDKLINELKLYNFS